MPRPQLGAFALHQEAIRTAPSEQAPSALPAWFGQHRPRDLNRLNVRGHLSRFVRGGELDLLVELVRDASRKLGFACGRQTTYARLIRKTDRTVRTYVASLEERGFIYTVDRQGTNATYVNWKALSLHDDKWQNFRSNRKEFPVPPLSEFHSGKEESSSAPDPRTHTYEMQAAATSEFHPPALPRETGLSDAHECDGAFSPDLPAAREVLLPPGAPPACPLPAREGPQKPQKHRGESLPDPDLQRRLERLPEGRDAAGPIVRGIPPEEHRLIVRELEVVRPDHAGRYVHSLIRDWTRRRVVALEREQAELRARAAAQKRREAEHEAEAEQARASAQAAQERAAGADFGAEVLKLVREGGLSARGITSRPRAGPS